MTPEVARILVGVDGSENSRGALGWAMLFSRQFDAELVAIHAIGLLAHLGEGPPVPSHSHLPELRQAFEEEWCAPLEGSGITHRFLLLDGSPVPVILAAAGREASDLIVLGSRGVGGFAELLLGSTSHQVAEHATCPVLIVPPEVQTQV